MGCLWVARGKSADLETLLNSRIQPSLQLEWDSLEWNPMSLHASCIWGSRSQIKGGSMKKQDLHGVNSRLLAFWHDLTPEIAGRQHRGTWVGLCLCLIWEEHGRTQNVSHSQGTH